MEIFVILNVSTGDCPAKVRQDPLIKQRISIDIVRLAAEAEKSPWAARCEKSQICHSCGIREYGTLFVTGIINAAEVIRSSSGSVYVASLLVSTETMIAPEEKQLHLPAGVGMNFQEQHGM